MTLRVGVIADDFTGATDIAGFLVAAGLRTVQLNEPQSSEQLAEEWDAGETEAVVISLKTRSIPRSDAVAKSLQALRILQNLDAERVIFKYCSTFDSTSEGNIGPVTDALLEEVGEDFTVVVPGLPVNGRTVYQGNLFVYDQPLHESGMRDHPVNPMSDSNIMRLMEAQSAGKAANIPFAVVEDGHDAVVAELDRVRESGARYAVLDTVTQRHLDTIGQAVSSMKVVTGGSGLGSGIARALTGASGRDADQPATRRWDFSSGPAVVISGSCSQMTNRQVSVYSDQAPSQALDVGRVLSDSETYLAELSEWVLNQEPGGFAPMIYATAPPESVKELQERYGAHQVSAGIEEFFGDLAATLSARGVTRFIAAGGETSGAVTQALGLTGFEVGPLIAPGVPWTKDLGENIDLALKSGNFGDENFFLTAQRMAGGKQ